ncbi:hypothetical protein BEWA_015170 [Theileria equi strain WA]|uniref:Uncharacterized protein n=1 Tax=Theileria equi strain WA TaxID=1537102 RepID=L1LCR5_THEEQ|nr:hypothetical protein BEWA_015170 [Theileria equi strain WA]EKX72958.1 hypothetical protein BEWA_015170 [Theileria equi strain WA]|eukprot:XP_004832410.1 hypothetical protein BEWA_015170 [Theileria equi strain WA]
MDKCEDSPQENGFNKSIFVRLAAEKFFKKDSESQEQDEVSIETKEQETKHSNCIDWEDRNYPKFIKLVHYDIKDINEEHQRIMKHVHKSCFLYFVPFSLNLLTTIILAVSLFTLNSVV